MKIQTLSFAVVVAVASTLIADTLRIGAFTLPYRFEDTNVTDIVRHVVTNDVQAFCTQIQILAVRDKQFLHDTGEIRPSQCSLA